MNKQMKNNEESHAGKTTKTSKEYRSKKIMVLRMASDALLDCPVRDLLTIVLQLLDWNS